MVKKMMISPLWCWDKKNDVNNAKAVVEELRKTARQAHGNTGRLLQILVSGSAKAVKECFLEGNN